MVPIIKYVEKYELLFLCSRHSARRNRYRMLCYLCVCAVFAMLHKTSTPLLDATRCILFCAFFVVLYWYVDFLLSLVLHSYVIVS